MRTEKMLQHKSGFTLLELMVVVSIVAILSAIAIPLFLDYQTSAFDAQANSDLRNAANAEEAYFLSSGGYLDCTNDDCVANLPHFRRSNTVNIEITANNAVGSPSWIGVASSDRGRRTFTWDSSSGGLTD